MSHASALSPAPTGGASAAPGLAPGPLTPRLGAVQAIRTVVGMELRQRLRSRGWYVLLGVFFVLVGAVSLGALGLHSLALGDVQPLGEISPSLAAEREASLRSAGQWLFDGVLAFVLLLSLLVSPALAANAISGDRAGGTLAITQVTLLKTWHLMAGKWLASWAASAAFLVAALPWLAVAAWVGRVSPVFVLVCLVVMLVEFAVVTGIGVAVSAIAGRTLFAVVVTYLLVALLTLGTVLGFLLSLQFLNVTVQANSPDYDYSGADLGGDATEEEWEAARAADPAAWDGVADSCIGPLEERTVPDPRMTGWMLAANPFAVLADAAPWDPGPTTIPSVFPVGGLNMASLGLRWTQADPRSGVECLDGELRGIDGSLLPAREGTWPVWPLGLALQGALTAGLMWWGWRRLDTPAGRLPTGTRIA